MRTHRDANMSFHQDRQSPPLIEATRAGSVSLPGQPSSAFTKCPLPAPAVGAPCTTSRSPLSPGSAPRGARTSDGHNAPCPCAAHWDCPTFPSTATTAQPWNPEPLFGNYNECGQLSAVIIKANTNADNPTARAVASTNNGDRLSLTQQLRRRGQHRHPGCRRRRPPRWRHQCRPWQCARSRRG
jgi:hypothetical protein